MGLSPKRWKRMRELLDFVNEDPERVWNRTQEKVRGDPDELTVTRPEFRKVWKHTQDLFEKLIEYSLWRDEMALYDVRLGERAPPPPPPDQYIHLLERKNRAEGAVLRRLIRLEAISGHEGGIEQSRDLRPGLLRFGGIYHRTSRLVFAVFSSATPLKVRRCVLDERRDVTECQKVFLADRNDKSPRSRQVFCSKKCRSRDDYLRRGKDYYKENKRKQRSR